MHLYKRQCLCFSVLLAGLASYDDAAAQAAARAAIVFGTYDRPFAATSRWNMQPVSPVLDTSVFIPSDLYLPAIDDDAYSSGAFTAGPDDNTPVAVFVTNDMDTQQPVTVRIARWPAATRPAGGTDHHADIYADGVIHSFWGLSKNSFGGWQAAAYSWSAIAGAGWPDPAHFRQGARASGVPSSAGLIRTREIADGAPTFGHALAMSLAASGLSGAAPGYVYPATATDNTYEINTGAIPEGALLMLPADFDLDRMSNQAMRKIAATLMTYGGYVVDRNDHTPFVIYAEMGSGLHTQGNSADLQLIQHGLHPVINAAYFRDGNGEFASSAVWDNQNLNLLSMRAPGVAAHDADWRFVNNTASGDVYAYYDSLRQAVVFSAQPTPLTWTSTSGNGFNQVAWGKLQRGTTYQVSALTTGGGTLRFQVSGADCNYDALAFDSGTMENGVTRKFTWPDVSGVCLRLIATSGVNQVSSVGVDLRRP